MADLGQLYADLVRSASFQPTFQFRIAPGGSERLNVGDHVSPGLVFAAAATQAIAAIPNLIGPERGGFRVTGHDAEVTSKCLVRCKLGDQPLLCLGRAGKDQNPAGLTVNPVHRQQFGKVRRGGTAFAFFNQPLQRFFQRRLSLAALRSPVLIAGMSHGQHPRGLLRHNYVGVKKQNPHVTVARRRRKCGGTDVQLIARLDSAALIDDKDAVDSQSSCGQQGASGRPRERRIVFSQSGKNSSSSLFGDGETANGHGRCPRWKGRGRLFQFWLWS